MSQPQQIIFGTASNDWCAIDNSAASSTTVLNAGAPLGFDTPSIAHVPAGAIAQGSNSFGGTGTTTLDPNTDTVYADPSCATVAGNPVSGTLPSFKTVTSVLNNSIQGIRLLWKNPAVVIF